MDTRATRARVGAAIALAILAATSCGDDDDASPETTTTEPATSTTVDVMATPSVDGTFPVDASGRELALQCYGSGSPAVILDPGSGGAGIAGWVETPLVEEL